jgi:two-component sensor histidine kinase
MNMRSTDVKDAETLVFLKELESQARTMALVYEQLYQSENLARVAMRPYIEKLCSNVIEGFGSDCTIEKSLELEDISFDVSYAMPCGLIINELLTNSLKHAFPKEFNKKRKVTIQMHVDRDVCTIKFWDSGIGMPSGLDWRASKSIGLRLVNLWATHQLGGTLDVDDEGGTMFTVIFKIQERKE